MSSQVEELKECSCAGLLHFTSYNKEITSIILCYLNECKQSTSCVEKMIYKAFIQKVSRSTKFQSQH